jgi:hypothetical protein
MAFDVFISYPHQDKATADAACAKLEAEGIRCWIAPRDVPPGAEWAGAIVEAIDNCSAMVLIFSSSANGSKQIHREVQQAFDGEKSVVPFRIENVTPEKALRYYMGSVHWLDALTPPLEQHLQKLAASVGALVGGAVSAGKQSGEGCFAAARSRRPDVREDTIDRFGDTAEPGEGKKLVFVSYPKDIVAPVMKGLVSALIKRGFRIWLYDPAPYEFSAAQIAKISWQICGQNYLDQTLRAIRDADAVLFLISPWTLNSQFQKNELAIALNLGRFVPCIVSGDLHVRDLPADLQKVHVRTITERELTEVNVRMLVDDVASAAARKKRRSRR